MYRILLVCSAGMSTSLMVAKMQAAATEQGIEASIAASAEADIQEHLDNIDILLLGPQVRYLQAKMKGILSGRGVPIEVIDSIDYGTMNGAKVLAAAIRNIEAAKG